MAEDNNIPAWVDPDYGYNPASPRKPNMREMMEMIAGKSVEEIYASGEDYSDISRLASDLLYGSVGSNEDTRDFTKITEVATDPATGQIDADKFVAATQIATSQMYGGTTVSYTSGGYQTDEAGNTVMDSEGKPVELPPAAYIVGGNGTILRGLSIDNVDSMTKQLTTFGVQTVDWVGDVMNAMQQSGTVDAAKMQNNLKVLGDLQNAYNPWANYQDIWGMDNLITSVAPKIDNFKVVSGQTQTAATGDQSTEVVEQTITAPQATETTTTTTQPVADTTPKAEEAVPVTTYTPTASQVTPQTVQTGITTPQGITTTGTMGTPLQTAGLSAVPETIQVNPNPTGTQMANLTSQSQQGFGGQRTYGNQFGQRITVTVDGSGKPMTYVPPGYTPVQGQAEGGSVSEDGPDVQLARRFLGFTGPSEQLTNFLAANPSAAARMGKYQQAMAGMARNRVGAQEGVAGTTLEDFQKMQQDLITQTMQPVQSAVGQITPQAADFIAPTAGQAAPVSPMAQAANVATVQQAGMPTTMTPGAMTATTVTPSVQAETAATTAQAGTVSPQAQVTGQQQLTTSVTGMEAAQGTATMVNAPAAREIQEGELISGAADAEKAATFTEQIDAATATPTKQATVAGQLEGLMAQFEGGNTPAWAAGSMRTAMQTLAARGLGASSLAGQAVIQAAMEAALPIAQIDAQTQAQFESQNLSNRQQRAMLAAQQRAQFLGQEFDQAFQARVQNSARIGDIANMNFTAEQNIALENSRAVNTMNLNNLSNRQAMTMAEAAALSQLDMANLNNRQQAAVQNAQNFLQMEMQNLSNAQQTELFKSQQNIQAIFTDQAAENAAAQFNATSENQTDQFFANLSAQVGQFNAAQTNAMDQFNVNSANAMRQFNSEIQQQRDLFNAQNGLVVAQANAQWRQNIATLNTAAQNESNLDFAKTINALTSKNLDEIWQRERDIMSFAFSADQSAMDRALQIILADKELEVAREKLASVEDAADTELAMRFLFGTSPGGILKALNPFG